MLFMRMLLVMIIRMSISLNRVIMIRIMKKGNKRDQEFMS